MKPVHNHNCPNCVYLGTDEYSGIGVVIDMYFCKRCNGDGGWYQGIMGDVLVRRYSSEQHNVSRWVLFDSSPRPHQTWINMLWTVYSMKLIGKHQMDQTLDRIKS